MPVTARLSSNFYERLGDDVANELVALLNNMDAEYFTELRRVNEMNFARFDAKLEQRAAELRSELNSGFGSLRTEIARSQVVQMRWMIGMLIPLYLAALATLATTLRLR